jgi:hypothetical protein
MVYFNLTEWDTANARAGGKLSASVTDGKRETAIQALLQYHELFKASTATFPGPPPSGLVFVTSLPQQPEPTCGTLDPVASRSFLIHQQSIEKILELVDAVSSDGSEEVQNARKQLVLDIQEHQLYLDRIIRHEWVRQKLDQTTSQLEHKAHLPQFVQTGNCPLM